jgi:peptide/nickel transport system substrate-binding protein
MLGRRRAGSMLGGATAAWMLRAIPRAAAQQAADTLRITWRDALPNVDFYYNAQRTGFLLQLHVWDTLVYRDPDTFQLRPLLASAWKQVDETTIDFTLRSDIRFHNGDPFGADDVVYTINTVIADPYVAVPSNYQFLAGAEKLDATHVRVTLRRVFPAAMEYIAMVLPIWPKAYRRRVGAHQFSAAPIGTGPYRVTRVDAEQAIDLERFDGYFDDSPKGHPAIRAIAITEVADSAQEMDALLSGKADWIWDFPPEQLNVVANTPGLQAVIGDTMRVAYLNMDAAGRDSPTDPTTKLPVRQAIAMAIDRDSMVRQFMLGASRVIDTPCYPTQFGCDQGSAVHYDYDPAKARALLAQAGYAAARRCPGRSRTGVLPAAAMDAGGAILSEGRRHRCPHRAASGGGGDPAQRNRRQPAEHGKLGQLLDQRRLGVHAVFLRRRPERLHAGPEDRGAGAPGRIGDRP